MHARSEPTPFDGWPIADLSIATIRTLAMDAVQKANSGHPGTPMALAPLAYVLWTRFLRHNPANPRWCDRDRFVLSNGHASMLQYAMLYLTGYDLTLDDLKQFRQWGSKTPGHPEYGVTPGVETTTGPLGQGLMTAVGLAMAEAHLAATYNRPGHRVVNHYTYVLCGDGDLMEGASHEAASLAGHLGLGKLICVYDDNHITIDGDTRITYSDDVAGRFRAYGWHVQDLGDRANDLDALQQALTQARDSTDKPALIILRSHIGYGAPHLQDSPKAHGSPLGEDEVRATKVAYGWPADTQFLVPDAVLDHTRGAIERGEKWETEWQDAICAYRGTHPELAARFEKAHTADLPAQWDADLAPFPASAGPLATRVAGHQVLAKLGARIPWLVGGAADLASSTKTVIEDGGDFEKEDYGGRNLHWGIREHAMCAASSGLALHGGLRPFASTFFVFTDYARPAIRLAALMELPVIYVMTHDSIGLGEDGPTHQPVEHLASLRAMPNLWVIRPADANEVIYAWRAALTRRDGPTMLVLSRQKLPILERIGLGSAEGLLRGAYVLSAERGNRPDVILIATGSEVHLILAAQEILRRSHSIDARAVSMPSWELFREQSMAYQASVLPVQVAARLAVEAGSPQGWCEWVSPGGRILGITRFGASAPAGETLRRYGFTVEDIVDNARAIVER